MEKIKRIVYNRRFLFVCILLLTLVFVLFFTPITAFGDTGNSVSHDSSGDGDGDSGLLWFLLYLVFEHPIIGIPLIIILFVFRKPILKAIRKSKLETDMELDKEIHMNNNLDELKRHDPNFSEPQFITKVNNMYLQLQDSWMKKDWKPIRPFETDELFNMHARQLQRYIDNQETNVVENICILDTKIIKYEQDAINDIITVQLRTRINDYIIDDRTRNVKAGNPNDDIYMTYHWKLIRRKGVLTQVNNLSNAVKHCPNCGANVSINATGECEYCGSVISNGQYDWVLYSIQTISQD